jgi:hypothetical protein
MVPAIVIAEVLITSKVEEPLKAIVLAIVTSSLTVAVLLAAMVKVICCYCCIKGSTTV